MTKPVLERVLATRFIAVCVLIAGCGMNSCSSPNQATEAPAPSVLPSRVLRTPLSDTNSNTVVIADVLATGKNVTLVFWQTWCAPCRAEAPQLVAASRKYSNMEIIGVVSGPDEAVDAAELQRAIVEWGLPYRNVRDRALDLTRALDVRGTPTIVVLGAQGQVLYRGHKSPDWDALF
jgi:thiol-disulfide isomerase/thioredoxin